MQRFREDRPGDICFARGTFNAHPYVMGAMNAFLRRLETPEVEALYADLDGRWNARAEALNRRLEAEGLPVRVVNMSSIWTVLYTRPARYNWLLQYYLRLEGLALSWIGTGRLIFSLNYTDADVAAVTERFVAGVRAMEADAWWAGPATSNKAIRRSLLREMLAVRWRGLRGRGGAASASTGNPVPAE
jgi:glutamate-1-semialdehyde 2,1-aminomutase